MKSYSSRVLVLILRGQNILKEQLSTTSPLHFLKGFTTLTSALTVRVYNSSLTALLSRIHLDLSSQWSY